MTIQLTAPILEAGVEQAVGTQLTLGADSEAELVNRGVAVWVGDDPTAGGLMPALLATDASNNVTGLVDPVTGQKFRRFVDNKRRRGGVAVDWSAGLGTLSVATGGIDSAIALDSTVLYDGKPTVKCTFSTAAADTFVGRYTLTNPVSFKNFKNIVIPIKITASDAVGTVATAANPLGVWLKTASGKQIRLRLVCDGVGPDNWCLMSFVRGETSAVLSFAGGATWSTLDSETITEIDFVHIAASGIVSNSYPVWIAPLLVDSLATSVVSLRLDGEYASQYSLAWPVLQSYGLVASMMIQHSNIGTAGRMTLSQIDEMYAGGCEVGMHTYDATKVNGYANATDWPSAQVITDDIVSGYAAQLAQGWYRGVGTLVEAFTGAYFSGATTLARQRLLKQALSSAGVECMCRIETSYKMKNTLGQRAVRPLLVRSSVSLGSATVVADVVAQINQVKDTGEWLIITAHEIVADTATPVGNQIKVSDFTTICAAIKANIDAGSQECLPIGAAYAQTFSDIR